jgi:PleD family two-component response regulator
MLGDPTLLLFHPNLSLPRASDKHRLTQRCVEEATQRKNGTILLVDDDGPCRQTFSEILAGLGYVVLIVETGRAALDAFYGNVYKEGVRSIQENRQGNV